MATLHKDATSVAGELVKQGFHVSCTKNHVLDVSMPIGVKAYTRGADGDNPYVFKIPVKFNKTPWFVFHVKSDGVFWVLPLKVVKQRWGKTKSEKYITVTVPKEGDLAYSALSEYRGDEGFERLWESMLGITE